MGHFCVTHRLTDSQTHRLTAAQTHGRKGRLTEVHVAAKNLDGRIYKKSVPNFFIPKFFHPKLFDINVAEKAFKLSTMVGENFENYLANVHFMKNYIIF